MTQKDSHKAWVVRNEEQRLVEGIVYPAYQLDTYNTMMLPVDIAQMCYDFAVKRMSDHVDYEHNEEKTGCKVLRHWIAMPDDPDGYPAGSWVALSHITDDVLWDKVKRGEINGYSIHAFAAQVDFTGTVVQVQRAEGVTENSSNNNLLPMHQHSLVLCFDDKGGVIATRTSEVLGHTHDVFYATATQDTFEHSHPIKIG